MFRAPPLQAIPPEIAAVSDYAAYAERRLDPAAWAYLDGAAADEISQGWNRRAFDQLALLPRVLNSVSGGHCRGPPSATACRGASRSQSMTATASPATAAA